MENPIQELEFLDLSDINELEKHQLQSVLYAPNPNARYPELPWYGGGVSVLHLVEPPPPPLDWVSHQQYAESGNSPLVNGELEDEEQGIEQEGDEEGEDENGVNHQQAHNANGYPDNGPHHNGPPPTSVAPAMPAPVNYAQPFSNVYVNNMTANVNVHPYMTHHSPHGPPTFHHVAPPPMYATPPQQQHVPSHHPDQSGGGPTPPQQGQKKRYKGNSTSSNASTGSSRQVEVPHHPGPPPMAGGYPTPYPTYYYTPQHGQGGSPIYHMPPHPHMYHPHHPGHGPPPHTMYTGPLYQQGPPPPHHGGPHMPPVSQLEETMQQQYMASHHPMEHHHTQHHPPTQHHPQAHQPPPPALSNKHSPHHNNTQYQQHPNPQQNAPVKLFTPNQQVSPQPMLDNQISPQATHPQQQTQSHPIEENEQQVEWQEEQQHQGDEEILYKEQEDGGQEMYEEVNEGALEEEQYEDEIENNQSDDINQDVTYQQQNNEPLTFGTHAEDIPIESVEVSGTASGGDASHTEETRNETVQPVISVEASHPIPTPTPAATKTWASILKKSSDTSPSPFNSTGPHSSNIMASPSSVNKPLARVEPLTTSNYTSSGGISSANSYQSGNVQNQRYGHKSSGQGHRYDDPSSQTLGKLLVNTKLDHKGISLQPRGLINKSNYCYINATLQALIACPPFYNLLRSINKQRSPARNGGHYFNSNGGAATDQNSTSSYPIFNALLQLANEFTYLQLPPGGNVASGGASRQSRGGRGGGVSNDDHPDIKLGTPFTPTYVYQILASIRSDSAFNVEGRQEDAEEFLSFLLNGLNDEMLELLKSTQTSGESQQELEKRGSKGQNQNVSHNFSNGDLSNGTELDADDGDWKEVTKESKNKGAVVRRHTSVEEKTPVSQIFRGQVRTRVTRVSDGSSTENIQPFFTLALDIEKVNSVKEALDQLVLRDTIESVTSTKTNQETEAYQTVTLEELPFVLLLHLKCFDYKSDSCHKIQKALEFPVLLSLEPKLLSSGKNKKLGGAQNGSKNKQYKLFAVVYHDGKEASKGHYITDVFHVGYSGWIRYDDANVRFVSEHEVLHPRPPRVPYILYYRRADTIVSKNGSPNS